jgi:hypothetical protein
MITRIPISLREKVAESFTSPGKEILQYFKRMRGAHVSVVD